MKVFPFIAASEVLVAPSGDHYFPPEYIEYANDDVKKDIPIIGLGFPKKTSIVLALNFKDYIDPKEDIIVNFEYLPSGNFNLIVVLNGQKAKQPMIVIGESDEIPTQTIADFLSLKPAQFYVVIYSDRHTLIDLQSSNKPGELLAIFPTIHFSCSLYFENHPNLDSLVQKMIQI